MAHQSLTQQSYDIRRLLIVLPRRIPVPDCRTAVLEFVSIGSFLCVCLALLAEFS